MQLPLQITFRNMGSSAAVERAIREKAAKLEKFSDRIGGCRVVVEAPHRHHHQGRLYRVRVDLTLPGKELVASRERSEDHAHEDVYVAIRDAFDAVRRRVEDHERRGRGRVKHHEPPQQHARVSALYPSEDFGRLDTDDGRSVYFHRHSVVGASFDALRVGDEVRFVEEAGDQGPQASTVHAERPHHAAAG